MTILGRFTEQDGAYAGVLKTLTLEISLSIVPAGAAHPKAPSHRVLRGETECGAAWPADDEGGLLNVQLDDPAWPEPLRARLVRGREADVLLVWRRPSPD